MLNISLKGIIFLQYSSFCVAEGIKFKALVGEDMRELEKLCQPPVLISPIKNSNAIPRMRLKLNKKESTAEKPIYTIV